MKYENLYEVRKISNIKEMLNSSAEIYGDKAAFLIKTKESPDYVPVSYKKFKADVDALGTALIQLGLKGKKVAIIGENRYEWSVAYLATVNGAGIVVPLDKELPQNEISSLVTRSEADAIIYSSAQASKVEVLIGKSNTRFYINMDAEKSEGSITSFALLKENGAKALAEGNTDFINAKIDDHAMSILLFTSGTTDKSKAVMLSHRNVSENLMNMCSMLYIGDKDVFLSVLPLHHTYECTCGFLCQIYRGCTIAYCEGLRHIVKNLKESKTTVMNGVPLVFESIYKQLMNQVAKKGSMGKLKMGITISNVLRKVGIDIRAKLFAEIHEGLGGHMRLFISGAAAIDPLVSKGFRDIGIKLVQGYGLTECAPIVALNRDILYKDDAAGIPLPNLEVAIDSPDADGIGEIKVKGSSVMLGYYQDPEATARVIKDGWFYTGDQGFIDSDNFVHITGRKKNVIVTKNGKNIYPEEIETLLNRSPYVKESLVYGKSTDDGDTAVCAVIVPDHEKIEEDLKNGLQLGANVEEIIGKEVKRINKELVTYKYIRDFGIREEEFIKTTTRKIKRYQELKNQ